MPTVYTGTDRNPVQLDPFQTIVDFNWGGGIGVLIVDYPDGIGFTFNPFTAFQTTPDKHVGDVITRDNFAHFEDSSGQHRAQISLLSRPPIILSTLYGEGDMHWLVGEILTQPGPDPGVTQRENPFTCVTPPKAFPNPNWVEHKAHYDERKAYWIAQPHRRFLEVDDVLSLGDEILTSSISVQGLWGPGENWGELHYGLNARRHYELHQHVPLITTIFGCPWQDTLLITETTTNPGNIAFQWFDLFTPTVTVGWGLGLIESAGNPGRKAVRKIYFFDFDVIKRDVVSVAMTNNGADEHLTGGYDVKFRFQLFPKSTRFTLTADSVTGNPVATYNQLKTFPYTQTGVLFRVDRKGFVV